MYDELKDEDVMDVRFFKSDLEDFDIEAAKIESLYESIESQVNKHTENDKFIGRGVLPHIQKQTESMVSLRSTKASLLNMRLNAKMKIADLAVKKQRLGVDDTGNTGEEFAKYLLSEIMTKREERGKSSNEDHQVVIETIMDDDELDKLLDEKVTGMIDSGDIDLTDNEQVMKYEKGGAEIKVIFTEDEEDRRFIVVDDDDNEILGYPETLIPNNKLLEVVEPKDGVVVAGGKKYNILETE